jgi:glucose/arabinose dehydrogenase
LSRHTLTSRAPQLLVAIVLLLLAALLLPVAGPAAPARAAATLPAGFREYVALSGLDRPTNIKFAPDGRLVVAEKSGTIKVFNDFKDSTPDATYNQLRTNVHNFWDRGLLGLEVSPNWPSDQSVYVLYAHDAAIGGTAPRWGTAGAADDNCPTPPGATDDGCVVSGRLSKVTLSGASLTESVLIEDWCQQYPSHSIGGLAFGADGQLYVSGGDGASFNWVDYGQDGSPVNPCGDPPGAPGTLLSPPTAEGGALRSQDLRTGGDPAGLNGAILRVDPATGAASAGNPNAASSDPNARRIVAYGLRNPFRITVRPGTSEVFAGDVGWNTWEEVDRTVGDDAVVDNFGWPCYEGAGRQSGYDGANLSICENLYTTNPVTAPVVAWQHGATNGPSDACGAQGGSSATGLAFYPTTGNYPAAYRGALFFSDYTRNCMWVMQAGADGQPDPATRTSFVSASHPVDLEVGPDGDLYYVDLDSGAVRRIGYSAGNQAPVARVTASPTSGNPPLAVNFSAAGSTDADPGDTMTFAWDLDNDGAFDDATGVTASFTYTTSGAKTARVQATDTFGATDVAGVTITVGQTAPVPSIDTPTGTPAYAVGATVSFSGSATDPQQGTLPASALSWSADIVHCPDVNTCHRHPGIYSAPGVASGSFTMPDHEPDAYVELRLTATDADGNTATATKRLDFQKVTLTFASNPPGVSLTVGSTATTAPFSTTQHVGGGISISAPGTATVNGVSYAFSSWSDGGAMAHNLTVPASPTTYTATYTAVGEPPAGTVLFSDDFEDGNATGWTVNRGGWSVCQPSGATLAYCADSKRESISSTGDTGWRDYSVQSAVRPTSTKGSAGVLGRVADATHWYELRLDTVSGQRRWIIAERNGSSTTTLAQGAYGWTANTTYQLRLDLKGSTLTASVATSPNGPFTTLGSVTDSSYASGRIGLRSDAAGASFDLVKVIKN